MRRDAGTAPGQVPSYRDREAVDVRRASDVHLAGPGEIRRLVAERWRAGRFSHLQAHVQFLQEVWARAAGSQAAGFVRAGRRWLLDQCVSESIGRAVFRRYPEVWQGFEDY